MPTRRGLGQVPHQKIRGVKSPPPGRDPKSSGATRPQDPGDQGPRSSSADHAKVRVDVNAKRLLLTAGSLAALASSAAVSGCAEERPPINRVQPYALEKTWFVGEDLISPIDDPEFWHQATLVDVGYGAAQDGLFTSTYAQPMSRLKWEVTEDLLIGRIAYERIDGTDG